MSVWGDEKDGFVQMWYFAMEVMCLAFGLVLGVEGTGRGVDVTV